MMGSWQLWTGFLIVVGSVLPAAAAPEGRSETPSEVFVRSNDAYEAGDHETAIDGYRSLLELQPRSGRLFYNLGNAYLRQGELGQAVAAFRHATKLRPRDQDIRANLEFARKSTRDAISPPSPSPVLSTIFFWHFSLGSTELVTACIVVNLLFWTVAAVRLFWRPSTTLNWLLFVLLIPLAALTGSVFVHEVFPQSIAVVLPQEIDAHSGPSSDSVIRFKLHAGTEIEVRDRQEGWLRVELPDGQQGWIRSEWATLVEG